MRVFVVLALLLGACGHESSPRSSDTSDPPAPSTSDASNASDKKERTEECVVEIDGRCFNYDPREQIAKSAYQRAQEKEPDVVSARVAASRHTASQWKRDIRYTDDAAIIYARIIVSEEGFHAGPRARGALWQVIDNVRAHHCDNRRLDHVDALRRITQCRKRDGELVDVGPLESVEQARETYLSAMRRLSPHVTGVYDPKRDRQRWTSTLRDSDEPPAAWVQCVAEGRPRGCHGDWRLYAKQWSDIRAWAGRVTSGDKLPPRPCPAPVIAWGGPMDDAIAKARGLKKIDCDLDDARNNRFWAKPRGDAS